MKAIWINNILYEHQDKVMNHYNLEPADEYVKKVFPDAVYMERREDWTHVFIPHQGLLEANSFTYKIDDKWYDSWGTSDLDGRRLVTVDMSGICSDHALHRR